MIKLTNTDCFFHTMLLLYFFFWGLAGVFFSAHCDIHPSCIIQDCSCRTGLCSHTLWLSVACSSVDRPIRHARLCQRSGTPPVATVWKCVAFVCVFTFACTCALCVPVLCSRLRFSACPEYMYVLCGFNGAYVVHIYVTSQPECESAFMLSTETCKNVFLCWCIWTPVQVEKIN